MFQGNEESATKITVGLIAAIAVGVSALISLVGIIVSIFFTRKSHRESIKLQKEIADQNRILQEKTTQRNAEITTQIETGKAFFNNEIEVKKQLFQRELESIKASFDDENAEKKARRDYEYEARQRLYREIEPLLFQLTQLGEDILYRISGLALEARHGNLRFDGGWLSDPRDYYATSNMYKLIAPLAIIKLMQKKLTSVDLNLVPRISKLYKIAKFISWSLTDDFEIKKITGLSYDPNNSNWRKLRETNQSVYWRQGIPTGRLDKAIDSIIDWENERCLSFGNFETEFHKKGSLINANFEVIFDIFYNFHPQTRPILWQILIIQSHLYHNLLENRDHEKSDDKEIIPVTSLRFLKEIDYISFDWRKDDDSTLEEEVFKPFETAEIYLKRRLKDLYQE